jgi:hypothetical protein
VILLHPKHDQPNRSSPSFPSTAFENFPGISDLLPEVFKFQHQSYVPNVAFHVFLKIQIKHNWLVRKIFLNATFAMTILDSIRKIPRLVIIFVGTNYIKRQLETWRRGGAGGDGVGEGGSEREDCGLYMEMCVHFERTKPFVMIWYKHPTFERK